MSAQRFLADKVGVAAAASVAAMLAFNVFALSYQLDRQIAPRMLTAAMHPVELA